MGRLRVPSLTMVGLSSLSRGRRMIRSVNLFGSSLSNEPLQREANTGMRCLWGASEGGCSWLCPLTMPGEIRRGWRGVGTLHVSIRSLAECSEAMSFKIRTELKIGKKFNGILWLIGRGVNHTLVAKQTWGCCELEVGWGFNNL